MILINKNPVSLSVQAVNLAKHTLRGFGSKKLRNMKQIKNLIFKMDSPVQRFNDNRELVLSVYFLLITISVVLTLSILGI